MTNELFSDENEILEIAERQRKHNTDWMRKWRATHREHYNNLARERRDAYLSTDYRFRQRISQWKCNKRLKIKVLLHYGLRCNSCEYKSNLDALTIDHINNDACEHKEKGIPRSGQSLYRWIIRNNYPNTFQTLCMNCQIIKQRQKERDEWEMQREAMVN